MRFIIAEVYVKSNEEEDEEMKGFGSFFRLARTINKTIRRDCIFRR